MEMNNQIESHSGRLDEISLFEVWQILVARKWLIIAAPVVTILLGVVYLAVTKPLYECTANILVGQIGKEILVQDPTVVVKQLEEKYRLNDTTSLHPIPRLSKITHDIKNSETIISLKAEDHTADGAKAFLDKVVEEILIEQKRLFEQGRQIKRERLQSLLDQIETFEAYQRQLDQHVESIARQDSAQAAILAVEKGKFLATVPDLEDQLYQLRIEMSELESFPAKLLGEPRLPEQPFKPKRTLVLLLAGLSGLMLAVIGAFIFEFIERARQQMKAEAR